MESFLDQFEGLHSQVLAVSCDPIASKEAWGKWLGGISYPLVSDFWPHGEMSKAYGVFNQEFGRPDRSFFVVDKQGILRWIRLFKSGELPDTVAVLDVLREIENAK
jgi:alkyl hydroperoxide reductase subunit AhpC